MHHKSIVRARNENYKLFVERFNASVTGVMKRYDSERSHEVKFREYWETNMKEVQKKHI
jgi:hypothetical protein